MPGDRTSKAKLTALERRTQAMQLRRAGATYRQIGRKLGVSEVRAYQIVTDEFARLARERTEATEAVRQLEIDRLDAMFRKAFQMARAGDLFAMDRAIKLMERRAKYLGLDAPTKQAIDLNGTVLLDWGDNDDGDGDGDGDGEPSDREDATPPPGPGGGETIPREI